jgi:hypothetical protein
MRSLDRKFRPAEDEQIEIQLARPPSPSDLAAECTLELFEGDEQGRCSGRKVWARRHVERDDGIEEVRLVGQSDGRGSIQARNAAHASAGQGGQRRDCRSERVGRIADIRAKTDVRADRSSQIDPPAR